MRGKKYNLLYGVLTSLITLAILFGGQALFNKYAMAKPMNKIFEQIDGVESFQVAFDEPAASGGRGKIQIKLSGVKNLQDLYGQIITGLDKCGGAKKYDIILKDNRDARLEEFYYQIHYFIEEARDNSSFALMAGKIREKADAAGIQAKIYVDAGYIYLQLEKEKPEQSEPGLENQRPASQMYIVLPRKRTSQEAG